MSDFSSVTLRRISETLDTANSAEELLETLRQAQELLRTAPADSEVLDGAAFEWIPNVTPLVAYQEDPECAGQVREQAQETLCAVARRSSSPREAVLALLERLQFMPREQADEDADEEEPDECLVEKQLVAIMDALGRAMTRITSKKPATFVEQIHDALLPVLKATRINHRPAFCRVLSLLILATKGSDGDVQRIQAVTEANQELLAAVVLALYQQQDQHLAMRLFQTQKPLLARGLSAFNDVDDDGYGVDFEERTALLDAATVCALNGFQPDLDRKIKDPQASLGYFIIQCIMCLQHGKGISSTPLHVLMRASQAQLIDPLLLALQYRSVSTEDVYPLVELLSPIACMHPHPGYRFVALKTLSGWLLELQRQSATDAFVVVEDLIGSAPHVGLRAAVVGLVRELILEQPDGRLASPLLVTDIVLPHFRWSRVQEDDPDAFYWLNNESLIAQHLTLLYFLVRRGGDTKSALSEASVQIEEQLLRPLRQHLDKPLPSSLADDIETIMTLERVRENLDRLDQALAVES